MDLGTNLREARERAGFSLPELASRTKIPLKSLRAIEENDFAKVPPGIFVRSFIRTYAHEVGIDPAAAIAEFRAGAEPAEATAHDLHREADVDGDIEPLEFAPNLSESRPGWGYALIAAALLIGLISVNRYVERDQSETQAAGSVGTTPADSETPVATTGSGVQIELRAERPCWIKATVDGQVVVARLMQPGETETLAGQRDITMRVGDPAAISYSINGRSGAALGVAQVPVTVRFGADGRVSPAS